MMTAMLSEEERWSRARLVHAGAERGEHVGHPLEANAHQPKGKLPGVDLGGPVDERA